MPSTRSCSSAGSACRRCPLCMCAVALGTRAARDVACVRRCTLRVVLVAFPLTLSPPAAVARGVDFPSHAVVFLCTLFRDFRFLLRCFYVL